MVGNFKIVHFDRLKPCMKTRALNDELPAPSKSHNSSSLSQQPQVIARPDTPHDDEDLLLSDDEDDGQDHDTHPLMWVLPQKYLPWRNNTPSLGPPGIPDALRSYPNRELCPTDRYGPHIKH